MLASQRGGWRGQGSSLRKARQFAGALSTQKLGAREAFLGDLIGTCGQHACGSVAMIDEDVYAENVVLIGMGVVVHVQSRQHIYAKARSIKLIGG